MKRWVLSILAVISLISVSIAQAADLEGTYMLVPQKSDNVEQMVDSTVSKMNSLVRTFAQSKVSHAARASKKVSIAHTEGGICIRTDDNALPIIPTDGTTFVYRNREGDVLGLRMRMHGNTLEQTFVTDRGSRTNLCELSQDGNVLEIHVIIKSDYFDQPMKYKLVYYKSS
jgi:hypothetical protein